MAMALFGAGSVKPQSRHWESWANPARLRDSESQRHRSLGTGVKRNGYTRNRVPYGSLTHAGLRVPGANTESQNHRNMHEKDSPSAPVNVTVKHLKANSAVVTWDVLEDEVVIGFAISQQKKDVRMLRFIQEVNTTTRSCALWDLEEDTEYIVHVQSISIQGQSPASEPVLFKTPREAEKLASKNKGKCG
ncbi:PREDICTED: fibronectin type III domain-containing protein 5-like, partial [Chlamydotis macqueenii]|uniref:fibronectin type III domain-containing protein 5-like n=1 Tax=Chlamydotis macqueenii TaxID=187382 RepID=UPI0005298C4C